MKTLQKLSGRMYRIKLFLIAGLSLLAVYQASQLWFANITGRNFFLQFLDDFFNLSAGHVVTREFSALTKPFRMVSGAGDGRFSIKYSGLTESDDRRYADTVLAAVLEHGVFLENVTAELSALTTEPAYLLDYAFAVPAATFADAMGKPRALFTENGVTEFDRILIRPPAAPDEAPHVYFWSGNGAAHFTLGTGGGEQAADFVREIRPPAENGLYYELTNGSFAAVWPNGSSQPVAVTNPYANIYGDKLMSHIRSCVEPMFDNPAVIIETTGADGALMFVDSNTVVRYYQRDVLEYTNFRVNENTGASFASDFAAALAFIEADTYVVNEFYLAGYELNNGQYTFRFNYVINDFPLIMPAGWPGPAENGYAIEVAVESGLIVRYKKLAYNFHIESDRDSGERVSFVYGGPDAPAPALGYLINGDETLSLGLITPTEG